MITEIKCFHCGGIFEDEILEKNAICPHCGKVTPVMLATPAAKPTPAIQFSPSGYIHKNLMAGEVVTGTAVMHWVNYLYTIPAAFFAFFIACAVISGAEIESKFFDFLIIILAEIVIVGLAALGAFINQKTCEFAVTNTRVLMKCGIIERISVEIMLTKIESIIVYQGILGRLLDYGTIIVGGTGGTKDSFHKIVSPLKFRQKIQLEIENFQQQSGRT